jgi:hypothetical protein
VFTLPERMFIVKGYMRDRSYGATRKEDALIDSQLLVLMWFLTVLFLEVFTTILITGTGKRGGDYSTVSSILGCLCVLNCITLRPY